MTSRLVRFVAVAGVVVACLAGVRTHGIPRIPEGDLARPLWRQVLIEPPPDVLRERLCAEALQPEAAVEKVRIDCAIETGSALAPPTPASGTLSVVAFNAERGFRIGSQLRAFRESASMPAPDVILLSEVDRGCSRTGYRNVARDYAEALGMNYAYGVEYLELPRPWGAGRRIETTCEHGNAILSRFPIEEPRVVRFDANRSWYVPPHGRTGGGEPRLGGRMAITATLRVGPWRLQAYAFHLESALRDRSVRNAQALELLQDAMSQPLPRVLGGDSNFHGYVLDLILRSRLEPAVLRLEESGLRDVHRRMLPLMRPTHLGLVVIDLILSDADVDEVGVAPWMTWAGLSDHLPVWARLRLRPKA